MTCEYLLEKMKNDSSVVAITSGTPTVMGFTEDKRKEAGSQFVDVGIAEETAVALASGVAVNGGKPFYGVYSSFVQRTFDQVSQDVCINNSPITMVIYQGSVYGMNDVTHLGFQDIPMLSNIPNLDISGTGNKGRVSGHARLEYGADILSGCNKAAGRTDDFRWFKGDKGFWQTQQI